MIILRTGIGPAGTPAPAPKAGVYKGADMATTEHRQFRESLVEWIAQTGMQILTTDCPFEGSPCAGSWPGFAQTSEHRGLADSQPAQDIANQEFYKTLRSRFNTFLRVPDPCKPHHVILYLEGLVCTPSAGFDAVAPCLYRLPFERRQLQPDRLHRRLRYDPIALHDSARRLTRRLW